MGSKLNPKKIDFSVGGLVWVRRRNGSWWPGRIMGLHELSKNCLVSSRSGTPVKFLGREDASLDWYNLETSKRVKAFRCGEFGDCIEKAKASSAHSNKKTVKYARREDAILHALELESAHETRKHHEFHAGMDGSSGKEHIYMDGEGIKQELSQSGISFEDPNGSTCKVHTLLQKRQKTPNDSEDDGTQGAKRMRGIKDLVNEVEAKAKPNILDDTEGSVRLGSTSVSEPTSGNRLNHVTSSKSPHSYTKRRRYHVVNICENTKRKNRRRQLRKVLENSAMVSVPIFCEDGSGSGLSYFQEIGDRKVSTLESTDSDIMNSSLLIYSTSDVGTVSCEKQTSPDASESKNNDFSSMSEIPKNDFSDSLFDVPFVDEETHSRGLSPLFSHCASEKLQTSHFSQVKSISLSRKGLDKYGSTSFASQHSNNSRRKTKNGTSRWQLKGKRNSRFLCKKMSKGLDSRRSIDRDAEADDFFPGTSHMDEFSVGIISPEVQHSTLEESLVSDDDARLSDQIGDPKYLNSIKKFRQSRENTEVHIESAEGRGGKFMSLSRSQSEGAKSRTDVKSLPVSSLNPARSPSHHQSFFTGNSRYEIADASSITFQPGSTLFDVNVETRGSYDGQNVPLVSLMSKFSGKAIVGHPLTVEVCSNGYCDILITRLNYSPTSTNRKLLNVHVPTENFSDQSIDGETRAVDVTLQVETGYQDQLHLAAPRKSFFKNSILKSEKKSTKKKKKKHGFFAKKTRKLSSFSVLPKQEDRGMKTVIEKLKSSTVAACIPLTVVFSRISESLS